MAGRSGELSGQAQDTGALRDRITRTPRIVDAARAADALKGRDWPEPARALAEGVAGAAPFLGRLIEREGDWLEQCWALSPEAALAALAEDIRKAGAEASGDAALMQALRIARRRAALLIALADIGGAWELDAVTDALTTIAEEAVSAVADRLLDELADPNAPRRRDALASFDRAKPGFFLLAMGKLGARELNYSSDIDLIALFEPDRLAAADRMEAPQVFVRLTKRLVKILSETTGDGFVARLDLRLRPDPASTQVCLSTDAAETYYEAMGRTWERAAHIKARSIAGDHEAAAVYLERLSPFVFRRHLDFAAIEDAADMLRLIRTHEGGGEIAFEGQDVKLGAGGIREIEFLAQTRQLCLAGRDPSLRSPRTLDALRALTLAGRLSEQDRADLEAAYRHLRMLEHRLQMMEDRQTHRAPTDPQTLDRVAAIAGYDSAAALKDATLAHMTAVRRITSAALDMPSSQKGKAPERALLEDYASAMPDPEAARGVAQAWFEGRRRALRSPRARARLERLLPTLFKALGRAADPMHALRQFDRFLEGLPAGVQLLSLFEANPRILELIADICAEAPRLSEHLARRPTVLDAVLDRGFFDPPPDRATLSVSLAPSLASAEDYERALDAARRWAAEAQFRTGVGLIKGAIDAETAGFGFSDIAEAALDGLWPIVCAEHERRYGAAPGRGAAVVAFGKLGSREMTATSDLDLVVIYDAEPNEMSQPGPEGGRSVAAAQYYAKLTTMMVSALNAPTAEGKLYEVDMRLRPSGNAGPLAVSLESFRRYQAEAAWVWEQMALTRARVVAGETAVCQDAAQAIEAALAAPKPAEEVRREAAIMRGRLDDAHAAALKNPWSLKATRGGLIDLEFIAQAGVLAARCAQGGGLSARAGLERLREAGALEPGVAEALIAAWRLQYALQQVARVAADGDPTPETAGEGLLGLLLRTTGASDADDLTARVLEAQATVREAFDKEIGAPPES